MTSPKTTVDADSRTSAWEWAQVALLVVNLIWTTICLGGFLAQTMVVTSALSGALICVHFLERAVRSGLPRFHPAGWCLLPFLGYAAVNVAWVTPVGWLGWMEWWGWVQMIGFFWVVLNGVRSRTPQLAVFVALIGVGCGLVLLGCYQRFVEPDWLMLGRTQAVQFLGRSSGSFGSPNSLASFFLLLSPAMGALMFRSASTSVHRIVWGYLTVMFTLGLALTISRGAWLSLAIVLAVSPLLIVRGSARRRLAYLAGTCVVLVLVAFVVFRAVPVIRERFDQLRTQGGELSRPIMWRAAWGIVRERPVFGGGAGSYNVRFEQYRPTSFQLEPRWAHNEYLNVLSDYGIVGFALFYGPWIIIAVRCMRHSHRSSSDWFNGSNLRAGLAVGLAAFALQLSVDFSLRIPALAMTFAVIVAMLVQRAWPVIGTAQAPQQGTLPRAAGGLAAIGIATLSAWFVWPLFSGEAKRQTARAEIDRMAPGGSAPQSEFILKARDALSHAAEISPRNGRAWSDLSYATAALAQFDSSHAGQLGKEAERAADIALSLSREVPEFWIRRGVALDLQGRWVEAGAAFVEALKLAPNRAGAWYQQAVHLSLKPSTFEQAAAAATFALRLDPGNPEAHALRQRLAERSPAR